MTDVVTTRIVRFIGGHEGFVSTWYLDPVGIPTIGYGFTWKSKVFSDWWMRKYGRKMRRGDTVTKAEAHQVLVHVLAEEYAPPVDGRLGAIALRIREAALSFVFNAGAGALKWKWATALLSGDLREAARRWRVTASTAKGKRLPGLVRRRNEEADIAEFDRWPAWLGNDLSAPPETHLIDVDLKQAQLWLNDLGYDCGRADGIPGPRTESATKRFQRDHGTLKVDGIIGPATLSALQRAIDFKGKAGKVIVGGGATSGAGAAEGATGAGDAIVTPVGDAGWLGDVLLWGGLAIIAIGLGWLVWRYRDELVAAFKKL